MRVAVISDTHDMLRPEVMEQIRLSDAVIHAGDISSAKIVEQIQKEMRNPNAFYAVSGNADEKWATEEDLPKQKSIKLEKLKIVIVHNRKQLTIDPGDTQMVIFGHSHRYLAEEKDGIFWLNPGCCGKRRFNQEVSMAVLKIKGGEWELQKIVIENGEKQKENADAAGKEELSSGEMLQQINGILNRMKRGQDISKIAADLSLDPQFVEEVCRIYVTHPGVTPNGILDKIEVNRHISR